MSSLLDTVLDRLSSAGRSLQPITRVTLIGKLAPGTAAADFGSWCASFAGPSSGITGLLLVLPNAWIQTVEAPAAELTPYLRAMQELLITGDKLATVKVIASQEDVRSRYFPSFGFKSLSIQRSNFTEVDTDTSPLIADTAIGALARARPFPTRTHARTHIRSPSASRRTRAAPPHAFARCALIHC